MVRCSITYFYLQLRHEMYALWIYEDKVRVQLQLLLEKLVGRHESGKNDAAKVGEALPAYAPFLPGAAVAPNAAAAAAAPAAPAAARSEAAARHANLFASMWKPCESAGRTLPVTPVAPEPASIQKIANGVLPAHESREHHAATVPGGQDKSSTKKVRSERGGTGLLNCGTLNFNLYSV